jgi:hypothetical protein
VKNIVRYLFHLPQLLYFFLSIIVVGEIICKISVQYSFDTNEGWNAFWANAAWHSYVLYPEPSSLKLNNYLPLWFYVTGALGRLIGDDLQAGRILAGLSLLLNAVAVSLIVREITGRSRDCWFAGTAFLSIFALFYGNYIAIDDPQLAANLLMTVSIWLFVRHIDGTIPASIVPLMLASGLLKHNGISAPISISIMSILQRPSAFIRFACCSVFGLVLICAVLYIEYGSSVFASLLFPREYSIADAWDQTKSELIRYNVFLLIIPYLGWRSDPKAKVIFVYSIISLIQGFIFSGGTDVDVNVFFDFAICISIGLGLLQYSMLENIKPESHSSQRAFFVACWLGVGLIPPLCSLQLGFDQAHDAFDSAWNNSQESDLSYIKSISGPVVCENLAFCYWAGKGFEVDLNNLRTLVWAKPELEAEFVDRIASCVYSLIQLDYDWDDEDGGPLTLRMREALTTHYAESKRTKAAIYWSPVSCIK